MVPRRPSVRTAEPFAGSEIHPHCSKARARNGFQASGWKLSAEVTEHSNALDLEEGVFTLDDPRVIARSLKHSAEQSRRRKVDPYRSAMSMLTFYINRAGSGLSAEHRAVLGAAKDALRREFGREPKRHEPKKRTGRSRSS